MTKTATHSTTLSALLGTAVLRPSGEVAGHVRELLVNTGDSGHVASVSLSRVRDGGTISTVAIADLEPGEDKLLHMRQGADEVSVSSPTDFIRLEYDLLDQQIIDVNGYKVVRVNDVDLVWTHGPNGETMLRISEVEVGMRGAIRRILKGLPRVAVDGLAHQVQSRSIPWEFVDLIDRDPARRVRLKIGQDRLSNMHPSDIAEILEELSPAERDAVFESLDEELAAEALEEVDPKLQKALIENMDSERVAGIVEEMDPGAAADLLAELSDERSEAILEEMDPEERQEVEELLEFPADSAAGRMTTDFVVVPDTASVADAVAALRAFEGDPETIAEIYLVDSEEHFTGVVALSRIVLAESVSPLAEMLEGRKVSCDLHASGKYVAELFDKYNLRSLAVLDKDKKLAGIVYGESVISMLREGD